MKLLTITLVVVVLTLFTAGSSSALAPYATFWSGTDPMTKINLPLYEGGNGVWRIGPFEHQTREYRIKLEELVLDPDPFIAYTILAVDFGAPSSFGFSFFTPIVPTGSPNVIGSAISGLLTDITGDGVSLTPTSGANVQTSFLHAPQTSMGIDLGPAYTAGASSPGSTYVYGPYTAGPIAGPAGLWTGLEIGVQFGLSGGGDSTVLAGITTIESGAAPVPEPLSLLLLGGGVAVAGVARARRRA